MADGESSDTAPREPDMVHNPDASTTAILYRMVTEDHVCPYGLKSLHLLKSRGFRVEDHWLRTREQVDAFKAAHDVETTPQTFMYNERFGGYDDLRARFAEPVRAPDETSYIPIIALFATTFLMALAASFAAAPGNFTLTLEWFIAFSMCVLAIQKLRDLDSFTTMFLGYDLLARRWIRYAWLYPFAELGAGVLMIAGVLRWVSGPVAFAIGCIGAVSVFYAVYMQRRELKCACMGGDSNVPLGFVSLTENVMMVLMGAWTISRVFGG